MADPLNPLTALPGVAEAVAEARTACEDLRWHPAMRRRAAECRAEAGVRSARCSAALEGGRLPLELVRDAVRGAGALPDDASGVLVRGAVRAHAETEHLAAEGGRLLTSAPWQALARLHVAAATGLLPDDELGRPRRAAETPRDTPPDVPVVTGPELTARLEALGRLLSGPSAVPALVLAAVVQGELLTLRPFTAANGVVARAVFHAVVVGRGLDPMGVAVPEAAQLSDPGGYSAGARAYATGTAAGMVQWLRHCAWTVTAGAGEGRAVADAVLTGRLPET